jgi:hypothetical protein
VQRARRIPLLLDQLCRSEKNVQAVRWHSLFETPNLIKYIGNSKKIKKYF